MLHRTAVDQKALELLERFMRLPCLIAPVTWEEVKTGITAHVRKL